MELKDYFSMARRWAWLLTLGGLLGVMVGVLISILQTPVYSASTRIMVMRAPQEKANDYTYLSDQQLVQTYTQLLTTRPVIENASSRLGSWVKSSQVNIQQIGDTQTIKVTVEDGNPQRAADIANILVQVLVDQNEAIQAGRYTSTEQSIQAQISQIEAQISLLGSEIENVSAETVLVQQNQVETQIAALQSEAAQLQLEIQQLATPISAEQQALLSDRTARLNQVQSTLTLYQQIYTDLVVLGQPVSSESDTTRLAQLQTTLQLYQQIYLNLLDNLEAIRLARLQNTPNVVQIEAANVPSSPIRPKPLTNIALAGVIGLLLSGGIAFLVEYIDDTIRTPDDVEQILKLPIIGYIGDMSEGQAVLAGVHVVNRPRSPVAEAFRSLRTNLEFTNVDRSLNSILITSSGPGEGKTTVATNLAAIIAQGGRRVLIIDADMRRPRVHTVFGISNRAGLSTLFRANESVRSVIQAVDGLEGVFVMTSGSPPPNPTELLASARMDQILVEARREVDVIIVDSPPSVVADFQVLATKLDGVAMVIQPGFTHADAAFSMLEQLNRVNAQVIGVILNKIPRSSGYYGSYNNYYYPYQRGGYYEEQPQMQEQPVAMLPPAPAYQPVADPQTYVYYPPPSQSREPFFAEEEAPIRQDRYEPSATRDVVTQPQQVYTNVPQQNKPKHGVEKMERMQTIEILPPLTFTPYEEDLDDIIIRR